MLNESNMQLVNPLELDNEQIQCLDLSILTKTLPLYENKLKEAVKHLDFLKNETKKQQQKLNGLEIQKLELETAVTKFKKIDMDLSARESKALQELKKVKVMCPIYQYKMNNILERFQFEEKLKDYSLPTQWNEVFNNLLKQKQIFQETIDEQEKIIEEFIQKYLI